MKKSIKILFACSLILLGVSVANAQKYKQIWNNVAIWGSGGLSSLSVDQTNLTSSPGMGSGIGVGLEIQQKKFSFLTGFEFTYLKPGLQRSDFTIDVPNLIDDEGDKFTGHYTLENNFDRYTLGNINFTLQFGLRKNNFYLMAGIKPGLNIFATSQTQSHTNFSGTYEDYLGEYENMPNHSFSSFDAVKNYVPRIAFNCSGSAEAGFYTSKNSRFRIGAFLDYGFLNINGNSQEFILLYGNGNVPYLNNFMKGYGMPANLLYGGIKLTYLLRLKDNHCNCEDVGNRRR